MSDEQIVGGFEMEIDKYKQIQPTMFRAARYKWDPQTRQRHKISNGYNEITTPSGAYKEEDWDKLMLAAVEKDGLGDLLEGIKAHVRTNCLWLKESDIEHHALSCLSSRAYEAWESLSYQQSLF
jgi:hypothetical protein